MGVLAKNEVERKVDRIKNLVHELQRCLGYGLFRQFAITCAIILEGIIIELDEEKDTGIIKKFKEKNMPITLGKLIREPTINDLLGTELIEICERVNILRKPGAHYSRVGIDGTEAYNILKRINDFALQLRYAAQRGEYESKWEALHDEIVKTEDVRHKATAQIMFPGVAHHSEGKTYLIIFEKLTGFFRPPDKAVFGLVFKYNPKRVRDLLPYAERIGLTFEELMGSLKLFQYLDLISLGRPMHGGNISDFELGFNESVRLQARKYCALFWNYLLGEYKTKDPDPPGGVWPK